MEIDAKGQIKKNLLQMGCRNKKPERAPSGIVRKSEEDEQTLEEPTIKDKQTILYNE